MEKNSFKMRGKRKQLPRIIKLSEIILGPQKPREYHQDSKHDINGRLKIRRNAKEKKYPLLKIGEMSYNQRRRYKKCNY